MALTQLSQLAILLHVRCVCVKLTESWFLVKIDFIHYYWRLNFGNKYPSSPVCNCCNMCGLCSVCVCVCVCVCMCVCIYLHGQCSQALQKIVGCSWDFLNDFGVQPHILLLEREGIITMLKRFYTVTSLVCVYIQEKDTQWNIKQIQNSFNLLVVYYLYLLYYHF